MVVDYLDKMFDSDLAQQEAAILCLYCNYKQDWEETAQEMLSAMLKQLVQRCTSLSDPMKVLYARYRSTSAIPTFTDIMSTLKEEMKRYKLVFLILDALDELGEHKRRELLQALTSLPVAFRMLATSRDVGSIDKSFDWDRKLVVTASSEDLKMYIRSRATEVGSRLRKFLEKDRELEVEVISKVAERAQGM
jgi:Cdc6-like AAA superfamily ATPase